VRLYIIAVFELKGCLERAGERSAVHRLFWDQNWGPPNEASRNLLQNKQTRMVSHIAGKNLCERILGLRMLEKRR